eukprot:scaffold1461_cov253-Pinguiococcus_pyrenoidosus.AAC.4
MSDGITSSLRDLEGLPAAYRGHGGLLRQLQRNKTFLLLPFAFRFSIPGSANLLLCDTVAPRLELVVVDGAPVMHALVDERVDKGRDHIIAQVQAKPTSEALQRSHTPCVLEAGEAALERHDLHQALHGFAVLSRNDESVDERLAELLEGLPVLAAENFYVLGRELERRAEFHAEGLSGRDAQDEAEVDVNQMPFRIEHDVTVVAVLDQQKVLQQRVARQRGREGELGGAQGAGVGSIHVEEVRVERPPIILALLQRVEGDGVRHHLDAPRHLTST